MLTVFRTFGKVFCRLVIIPALLLVTGVTAQAGDNVSFTMPVTLTVTQPTCNASITGIRGGTAWADHVFEMDVMTRDYNRHASFGLNLSCQNVAATDPHVVFYAKAIQGTLDNNYEIHMLLDGKANDSAPYLALMAGDTRIDLTGNTPFCDSDATSAVSCKVTPYTWFPPSLPTPFAGGEASATVSFTWEWK